MKTPRYEQTLLSRRSNRIRLTCKQFLNTCEKLHVNVQLFAYFEGIVKGLFKTMPFPFQQKTGLHMQTCFERFRINRKC